MRWLSCLFIGGIGVHEDLSWTPEERTAAISRCTGPIQRTTAALAVQSTTLSIKRRLNRWLRRRRLCHVIAVLLKKIHAIAQCHHITHEARDSGSSGSLFT